MVAFLERFNRLARLFFPLRHAVTLFTLIALLITAYCLLVDTPFSANALQPAVAASLWGMLMQAFIQLFQKIPGPVSGRQRFFAKLLCRIKLFFYSLLALIVVIVTVLLIWLSLRLLFI